MTWQVWAGFGAGVIVGVWGGSFLGVWLFLRGLCGKGGFFGKRD